jgi:hypothetical protein
MAVNPIAGPGRDPTGHSVAVLSLELEMRERSQQRAGATTMAITQADLERLDSANEQQKHWKQEYQVLRESILARYRKGGYVEPGYLDLSVSESEQRQFSRVQLVRLLGEEETEQLRGRLILTIQYKVTVIKSG